MLDKKALETFIEEKLAGTDLFLTDLKISSDNVVTIEIDSDSSVDIDKCVELSREIEKAFDRDKEDYELEVGSAGITSPLKVRRQFQKYIGKDMVVSTKSGKKVKGILKEVKEEGFILDAEEKVRVEGAKRPEKVMVEREFPFAEVKEVKYDLKF